MLSFAYIVTCPHAHFLENRRQLPIQVLLTQLESDVDQKACLLERQVVSLGAYHFDLCHTYYFGQDRVGSRSSMPVSCWCGHVGGDDGLECPQPGIGFSF